MMSKFKNFLAKYHLPIISVCLCIIVAQSIALLNNRNDETETNASPLTNEDQQNQEEKVSSLTEAEKVAIEYLSRYYKPGKVKVATLEEDFDTVSRTIYIFIPRELRYSFIGGAREQVFVELENGKWIATGNYTYEEDTEYATFEELKQSKFWRKEGRFLEWKDAEFK